MLFSSSSKLPAALGSVHLAVAGRFEVELFNLPTSAHVTDPWVSACDLRKDFRLAPELSEFQHAPSPLMNGSGAGHMRHTWPAPPRRTSTGSVTENATSRIMGVVRFDRVAAVRPGHLRSAF